mgnify:CR=1 FL=1
MENVRYSLLNFCFALRSAMNAAAPFHKTPKLINFYAARPALLVRLCAFGAHEAAVQGSFRTVALLRRDFLKNARLIFCSKAISFSSKIIPRTARTTSGI